MKLTFRISLILATILICNKTTLASSVNREVVSNFPIKPPIDNYAQLSTENSDFQLRLLIKAIRQFLNSNPYEMESQFNISGNVSGISIDFYAQVKTVLEAPKRFLSKIKFTNDKVVAGKEYVVLSNGSKVWIHNLAENIYSVTDYRSFNESQDAFLIGMLSSIFLEIWENKQNLDIISELSEDELLESLKTELGINISQIKFGKENLDGKPYATYAYTNKEEGFVMTAFIDPITAEIKQLHLAGLDDQFIFIIKEQVIKKTVLQSIPSNTFTFIPTPNAVQVAEPISIQPY